MIKCNKTTKATETPTEWIENEILPETASYGDKKGIFITNCTGKVL